MTKSIVKKLKCCNDIISGKRKYNLRKKKNQPIQPIIFFCYFDNILVVNIRYIYITIYIYIYTKNVVSKICSTYMKCFILYLYKKCSL